MDGRRPPVTGFYWLDVKKENFNGPTQYNKFQYTKIHHEV